MRTPAGRLIGDGKSFAVALRVRRILHQHVELSPRVGANSENGNWLGAGGLGNQPQLQRAVNGGCWVYMSFAGIETPGVSDPGWYIFGGTSEASPIFSGIVALADQVAGHRLGPVNPALYRLAAAHAPGIVDITQGHNTVSFTQGGRRHTVRGFAARRGYDLATGVGTVNAALFVPELAAAAGH